MNELKDRFPEGVTHDIAYDTTQFISESIADVVNTLLLAVMLVGIVVFAFLQSWRAVLDRDGGDTGGDYRHVLDHGSGRLQLEQHFAVPGLVLAIGIVVDDAIVVVENVEPLARPWEGAAGCGP